VGGGGRLRKTLAPRRHFRPEQGKSFPKEKTDRPTRGVLGLSGCGKTRGKARGMPPETVTYLHKF